MPSYADLHKAKAVIGSMLYAHNLLDELACHPRAEQHSNDQDVQKHLDLGHALVPIPKGSVNVVVPFRADCFMHSKFCFYCFHVQNKDKKPLVAPVAPKFHPVLLPPLTLPWDVGANQYPAGVAAESVIET